MLVKFIFWFFFIENESESYNKRGSISSADKIYLVLWIFLLKLWCTGDEWEVIVFWKLLKLLART